MIGGILSLVQALRTDYTTVRAGYLDTNIGSRASSSAVSTLQTTCNSILTNANTTVSSRASQTTADAILADTSTYLDAAVSDAALKPCLGQLNASETGSTTQRLDQLPGPTVSTTVTGTSGVWYPVASYSGKGVITWAALYFSGSTAGNWDARLLINGVQRVAGTVFAPTGSGQGWVLVGAGFGSATAGESIMCPSYCPFTTSFSLDVRRNGSSGSEGVVAKVLVGKF